MTRPLATAATYAVRLVVFGALWWVVSEGETPFGAVPGLVIAVAAGASLRLVPPRSNRVRWGGALRFVPFFLGQAIAGGLDVARRAWLPRLPIDPGIVTVPLLLRSEHARVALAWAVSLLPGTASAGLRDDGLTVHALDRRLPLRERLLELERRLADAFVEEQ